MERNFRAKATKKMKIIFYIVLTLFLLKLIWNISIPIDFFIQSYKKKLKNGSGVTLMPDIEITLLIILFCCSFFIKESIWYYRPFFVLIMGFGVLVCSYGIMFLIGKILSWCVDFLNQRRLK